MKRRERIEARIKELRSQLEIVEAPLGEKETLIERLKDECNAIHSLARPFNVEIEALEKRAPKPVHTIRITHNMKTGLTTRSPMEVAYPPHDPTLDEECEEI